MIDYLYKGKPVVALRAEIEGVKCVGDIIIHIQPLKPCGCMYGVKERPEGFEKYKKVKFSELTEVDHAKMD